MYAIYVLSATYLQMKSNLSQQIYRLGNTAIHSTAICAVQQETLHE